MHTQVEKIRAISQCAASLASKGATVGLNGCFAVSGGDWLLLQEASADLSESLAKELMSMSLDEAIPLTRACGQYLHLTGIAELQHRCVAARVSPSHLT